MRIRIVVMLVCSLLLLGGWSAARADFASDLTLVNSNQLTLEQAVTNALNAGVSLESIIRTARARGVDLVQLAAVLLAKQYSQDAIRTAMIAVGIDADTANASIVVALSTLNPPGAGPRGTFRTNISGNVHRGGQRASPF